ncbi:hypothetical protein D3C71_586480 [compost metagenome]
MRGTQRAGRIGACHRHRDVALGRPLRDRQDVHLRPAQRFEQSCGHAWLARHAIADRGQHADALADLHALHLAGSQFVRKRLHHRIATTRRFACADNTADRMFGRALRDHHYRDLRLAQRGEHAFGGTRHADQTGAFQIQQGQIRAQRQSFHRATWRALGADAGTRMAGLERIADEDRQAQPDCRRHGLRMHHLGPEVGQLAGLVVAQRVQLHGLRHQPRVGRQHAVDVGPDMQFIGIEQRGEDRTGIVAAVAAQRGDATLAVAGDEPGNHHAQLRVLQPPRGKAAGTGIPVDIHAQFAMADHQHIACIQHRAVLTQRAQMGAEQLRGEYFAQALHAVEHFARQFTDHRQCGQHLGQLVEARVDPVHGVAHLLTQQRYRGTAMARAQCMPGFLPAGIALGCQVRQFDQRVGNTLHGRDHADLQRLGAGQQQTGNMAIALSVGHRSTAELVHDSGRRSQSGRSGGMGGGGGRHADLGWRPRRMQVVEFPRHLDGAGPLFSGVTRRRRAAPGQW